MRLHDITMRTVGDRVRVGAQVERTRGSTPSYELFFQYPLRYQEFVSSSADAFAVGLLIPALVKGEPLQVVPPVSSRLAFQLPRIRDIFCAWYPHLPRIDIDVTTRPDTPAAKVPRAATFFSGGVDSFYSLLKYRVAAQLPAPLTHLIFMRGIETKLGSAQGVDTSERSAEEVARALGIDCVPGESNVRDQLPSHCWEKYFFGSALAATALSLANGFGYVCIPSSYSYHHPVTCGSTPLVDERYSTDLQIVHDGAESRRVEKVARIVEWNRDVALGHLRVCLNNRGGNSNCGMCKKCVRTLIPLMALGVLDAARTFPQPLNGRWLDILAADHLEFLEENLAFVRARGGNPDVARRLAREIRRRRRRQLLREAIDVLGLKPHVPARLRARMWGTIDTDADGARDR